MLLEAPGRVPHSSLETDHKRLNVSCRVDTSKYISRIYWRAALSLGATTVLGLVMLQRH